MLALFGAEPDPRWVSGPGVPGSHLVVADSGDVTLVAPDGTVSWRPDAPATAGSRLVLQDDGDLVVLDPQGARVWESGTAARPSILPAGGVLEPGDALSSPDGRQTLLVLDDGDVALLGPDATTRWSTGTDRPGASADDCARTATSSSPTRTATACGEAGQPGTRARPSSCRTTVTWSCTTPSGRSCGAPGRCVGPSTLAGGAPLAPDQQLSSPDGHLHLRLAADGLALAYDDTVVWTAQATEATGLTVRDDGDVVLTGADGAVLWSTARRATRARACSSRKARCSSARRPDRSCGGSTCPQG